MGDLIDMFEGMKEMHEERVAKTPSRIEYAIEKFELKNPATGHFHCWRKSDGRLYQFYAGTGKIQGYNNIRGIHALIRLLV